MQLITTTDADNSFSVYIISIQGYMSNDKTTFLFHNVDVAI